MSFYENNLGYLLNKASRIAKWELNSNLGEIGLTSVQWAVLRDVYSHENTDDKAKHLTPASIAERLHSDRPTISGVIERLVIRGWLVRAVNPDDRRSQVIGLTDKSRDCMSKMSEYSDEVMAKAVKGFSDKEIDELKEYLIRIINNLS